MLENYKLGWDAARYLIVVSAFLMAIYAWEALAQDGKPKIAYKPTEIQQLRLEVKQKDAQLAQNLLQQAQQNFQKALTDLGSEGEKVKVENNWPKTIQFNPNDLSFSEPTEAKKQ